MSINEALKIVLELAEQNVIEVEEGDDEILVNEQDRQIDAIEKVREFIEEM